MSMKWHISSTPIIKKGINYVWCISRLLFVQGTQVVKKILKANGNDDQLATKMKSSLVLSASPTPTIAEMALAERERVVDYV